MQTLLACLVTSYIFLVTPSPGASQDDQSPKPVTLKLDFPTIPGWELLEAKKLPDDGYFVGYRSEQDMAVTLYVFNRGLRKIPDEQLQADFKAAKETIHEFKRLGHYQEVKEVESAKKTLSGGKDGRPARYARFKIKLRGEDVESEIYVFGYQDHIIKLRITRQAAAAKEALQDLQRLKEELEKVFKK